MTTPQATFGQMIETVAGQAFTASGYTLEAMPMHQMRGLFRYRKDLHGKDSSGNSLDGLTAYVEFQLLFYQGGGPSRFRVNLLRNSGLDARADTGNSQRVDTTLAQLLWKEFDVQQLSGPDHWWQFTSSYELGYAIAEAAKLIFGFGIPYLEGTLDPASWADQGDTGM